jgi:hypothetical protein
MGGVSFPGVPAPVVRWLRTEGYTAFSSFTHLVTLPLVMGIGLDDLSAVSTRRQSVLKDLFRLNGHCSVGPRAAVSCTDFCRVIFSDKREGRVVDYEVCGRRVTSGKQQDTQEDSRPTNHGRTSSRT